MYSEWHYSLVASCMNFVSLYVLLRKPYMLMKMKGSFFKSANSERNTTINTNSTHNPLFQLPNSKPNKPAMTKTKTHQPIKTQSTFHHSAPKTMLKHKSLLQVTPFQQQKLKKGFFKKTIKTYLGCSSKQIYG